MSKFEILQNLKNTIYQTKWVRKHRWYKFWHV